MRRSRYARLANVIPPRIIPPHLAILAGTKALTAAHPLPHKYLFWDVNISSISTLISLPLGCILDVSYGGGGGSEKQGSRFYACPYTLHLSLRLHSYRDDPRRAAGRSKTWIHQPRSIPVNPGQSRFLCGHGSRRERGDQARKKPLLISLFPALCEFSPPRPPGTSHLYTEGEI